VEPDKVEDLRHRWSTTAGQQVLAELAGRIVRRKDFDGLPLGRVNGRIDLRYAPIPGDYLEVRKMKVTDVDFTAASFPSTRMEFSMVENCLFNYAKFDGIVIAGSAVRDSSFVGADLHEARLGQDTRKLPRSLVSHFSEVSFEHALLRGAHTTGAEFVDCNFRNASLDQVNFSGSLRMIRCTFGGDVRGATFQGQTSRKSVLSDVDFSDSMFSDVDVIGFDLSSVRLPRDRRIFVIKAGRLADERVRMESLVRSEETPARDRKSVSLILECVNSISSLGGGDVLINCADLGLGFEEVERVLSLIDSEINSPRGE
jgi:uncharacterized protein YjbI with pentapeptide repeats